jgi:2-keto-4-pentenoate hydratase/2-oxohepta-3-ene-1,7-dioic acid hydratase in catechol pathway
MNYQHHWVDGERIDLPAGKVVCAGLNYALHAKEMNSQTAEDEPVLFIKPSTALRTLESPLNIPTGKGAVHHELEIAVLIGQTLCKATEAEALQAVSGVGIGLDLTLRDLQNQLKKAGRPWEKSKAFDGSCPLSCFVPIGQCLPLNRLAIRLDINGQCRQQGNSSDMLFPIPRLLVAISQHFTLLPGDIVLTGTPEGVGPLLSGDQLEISLDSLFGVNTVVV